MEDMKNLIIQSLETKGVLGQIRANLRSAVFKMVDEQDQQFKLGCGLKWENPTLYKIIETKVGTLLSEVIREFMEYFRMDYALSIFIPECGISPERLKKDEILGKMGLNGSNEFMAQMQLPLLYYIMFYFIQSLKENPTKVLETIKKVQDNVEAKADEIIDTNIMEYYKNHKGEEDDIPLSGDRTNSNLNDINSNREPATNGTQQQVQQPPKNEDFPQIDQIDEQPKKKASYEDDTNVRRGRPTLDDFESKVEQKPKEEKHPEPSPVNNKNDDIDEIPIEEIDVDEIKTEEEKKEDNIGASSGEVIEEIEEKIEDSYDQSDKKSLSNNVQTISLSQGNDASVDSHALENYNYVEPINKDKQ